MKTTVVYHSADYDGIFCREIARKFLPMAELVGWNFGDKPLMAIPGLDDLGNIIVMDLPVDEPFGCKFADLKRGQTWRDWLGNKTSLTWIDHHASSIAKHPLDIPGYRIDGVAACRLAWQWFRSASVEPQWFTSASVDRNPMMRYETELPTKQDFIDRKISEPIAVRLAGEYDIWDKRDERADVLQYGLRCSEGELDWKALLSDGEPGRYLKSLLDGGRWAQRYAQKTDADLVTHRSYRLKWEGLDFLVLNTGRFNSLTFAALDKPETGHDALMGYMFNGKKWVVSLYHANHRKDLDLSLIAVKHGGGGHRGACGFTCDNPPWWRAEQAQKAAK